MRLICQFVDTLIIRPSLSPIKRADYYYNKKPTNWWDRQNAIPLKLDPKLVLHGYDLKLPAPSDFFYRILALVTLAVEVP